MKTMLITGATGTVGGELLDRYHGRYHIYAQGRDAQTLLKLRARYPNIKVVLGDLHSPRLIEAVRDSQVVIHAAAQKYVDLAERHCAYTLETNVYCTWKLAELATRSGVEQFVFVSTDKSSAPSQVYGMSKYLAERVVLELAESRSNTTFTVCRFGNIFGSNGSVIRLWLDALHRPGAKIQVTDPDMTRFMFSVEEAIDLIDFAMTQASNGDIIIPKMQAVRVRDLMTLFAGLEVQVVGKRPGEKMHETLYVKGEVATGYETDLYYVLNRAATTTVALDSIDSSQVPPVEPERLRRWFDGVRTRVAA